MSPVYCRKQAGLFFRCCKEIERLKSQLDALKSASAKEKEAKQMKILISQVKLYKDC